MEARSWMLENEIRSENIQSLVSTSNLEDFKHEERETSKYNQ